MKSTEDSHILLKILFQNMHLNVYFKRNAWMKNHVRFYVSDFGIFCHEE